MATAHDEIRARALELGFDAVGFARAESSAAARGHLAEFVAQGLHGDMGWMKETAGRRADPKTLWPEARSAVVVALHYGPAGAPRALPRGPHPGDGRMYAPLR